MLWDFLEQGVFPVHYYIASLTNECPELTMLFVFLVVQHLNTLPAFGETSRPWFLLAVRAERSYVEKDILSIWYRKDRAWAWNLSLASQTSCPGLWIHRENKIYETDTVHTGICAIMFSGRAIMVLKGLCRSCDTCLGYGLCGHLPYVFCPGLDFMNCTFSINKVIFCLNQTVVVSVVYNQATSMIRKEHKILITEWSSEWINAQIIKLTNKWIKQKKSNEDRAQFPWYLPFFLSFFLWPGLPQSFP